MFCSVEVSMVFIAAGKEAKGASLVPAFRSFPVGATYMDC